MPIAAAYLSVADLERLLVQTDSAVVLVSRPLLRRVVRREGDLSGLGLQVPHSDDYVIQRSVLLASFRDDLELTPGRELPDPVVLLPRPDVDELAQPPGILLRSYWRKLFHCRVHSELRTRGGRGPLSESELRNRIARIGAIEFAEATLVLEQDHRLLPHQDDRPVYEEFVALFLELRHFAPHLLRHTFPTLSDPALVERIVSDDVPEVAGLMARTRPPDAADPSLVGLWQEESVDWEDETPSPSTPEGGGASPPTPRERERAQAAAARGNLVRAALLLWRSNAPEEAYALLDRLVERLAGAVGTPEAADDWRGPLRALLAPATTRVWAREGRLLYDLQKVCIDLERPLYAVDILEWIGTLGRRPIKRLLPFQGQVRRARHLRTALNRLPSVRLDPANRRRLWELLQQALQRGQEELRQHFRPRLVDALGEAGLRPVSYAEQVARDQVVEELLDRVAEGGYLTLGQLRDALARNRLKLPDLAGPGEFVMGDPVLRANEKLAVALDGVYHRGEVYLRGLQRLSSLFFGTRPGRFLTLYLIVPLLGAFLLLEGLQYVFDETGLWNLLAPNRFTPTEVASAVGVAADPQGLGPMLAVSTLRAERHHKPHLLSVWTPPYSLPVMAVFLFALLHFPRFRRGVLAGLREAWQLLRGVLWDTPRAILSPLVASGLFQYLWQILLKPALYAVPVVLVLYLKHLPWQELRWVAAGVFGFFCLLLNTRFGARLEESLVDSLAWLGRWLGRDALPALFNLVMAFFKQLVERVDRLIYAVDEKLRFREGDGRLNLVGKALTGVVWGVLTYIVRFAVNLLIEPQVNPIKHFPVVTVSHKLILPLVPHLARVIEAQFNLEEALAASMAFAFLACIPGIFGFLAWELKENWRLYRANQASTLQPKTVGSHGETVLRLLRPGFHSGTLPKLFARLRRAERDGDRKGIGRRLADLHHVQEAVTHFAERGLVAVLAGSQRWQAVPLKVGRVRAGLNNLRIALDCPTLGERPLVFDFLDQAGYLVAELGQPGWLDQLSLLQRAALADAVVGFYKQAGVDLVREQIRSVLPDGTTWLVAPQGLLVRTATGQEAHYAFTAEGALHPQGPDGRPVPGLRSLPPGKLLFRRQPLAWKDWTSSWEDDRLGKGHGPLLSGVYRL
jgi:hypothetical protein